MGKELSAEAIPAIRKALDDACADQNEGLAGVSLFIANKEGKQLFAHASGKRGHGSEEPLTLDSVFWIASFTKLVTAIACMQLVEQGKLALDDADQLEELCPELKDVKVMQEDGTLVPKNKRITLRMLLTHTGEYSC
jgi:CubicO group peptidase (beta-lactamase class C family)